jgi:hypothetical protein
MKKIDVGQTITIVANLGVIAGIVFLGIEIRQNNELMAAEARFNRLSVVTDAWRFSAEHGDLIAIRERANAGETLTWGERRRINASLMAVFTFLEWQFRELGRDSPEMNQVRVNQRDNFANDASYNNVWTARRDAFDPEFVEWFETNVVRPSLRK